MLIIVCVAVLVAAILIIKKMAVQIQIEMSYDSVDNAYSSGDVVLTGDVLLKVKLEEEGRLAIRKSNNGDKWPIVLMSPWTGPDFEIKIYGETKGKHIKIQTTSMPESVIIENI